MTVEHQYPVLVSDLMAGEPITVGPEVPVNKVAAVLTDYDISGMPVVDPAGSSDQGERALGIGNGRSPTRSSQSASLLGAAAVSRQLRYVLV